MNQNDAQKNNNEQGSFVYGVNLSNPVTPEMVRDALVRCFVAAHEKELEDLKNYGEINEEEFNKIKRLNVEAMIENYFYEVGGDFDHPTKNMILKVIDKLMEFSRNFRDQEIIKKHYQEMLKIIEKLP